MDLSSSPASRVVLPGRHVVDTSTQLRSGPAGISRCLLPASVGVGWVALAPVSDRCAYAGVAEDGIYIAPDAQGRGVGRALLAAVVASAERGGIWTIQTGIFPENQASVRLHQACGFRLVGVRERLGRLDGRWRDVLLLERRSPRIT